MLTYEESDSFCAQPFVVIHHVLLLRGNLGPAASLGEEGDDASQAAPGGEEVEGWRNAKVVLYEGHPHGCAGELPLAVAVFLG